MYTTDSFETKYQLLINKRESAGWRYFNDSKVFIKYSNELDDICKNIEDNSPNKKQKIMIIFDNFVADMRSSKTLNPILTELFMRGRKLSISLVFIIQSCFAVPKGIRLNSTHYFVMKITNKKELQ